MPPLKGIDRGLNGEALKALEESGHGRRIAVVDASYNIPRWSQAIDYNGKTSVEALVGILKLVPHEGNILLMKPDSDVTEYGDGPFCDIAATEVDEALGYPKQFGILRLDTIENDEEVPGFYSTANDESVDTLFIRTRDTMAFACATFVVGHSQE